MIRTKLILFDAYATLFRLRRPIAEQYADAFGLYFIYLSYFGLPITLHPEPHFHVETSRIRQAFKPGMFT
jgi:FMN phosphatase YigB (HAD superfamily)